MEINHTPSCYYSEHRIINSAIIAITYSDSEEVLLGGTQYLIAFPLRLRDKISFGTLFIRGRLKEPLRPVKPTSRIALLF